MIGLGEPQGGDAKAIEQFTEDIVAEGVGIPLGHDDDGLFGPAELFFSGGGIPAGVDAVIFGIGGADRRGEAQELGGLAAAILNALANFGLVFQGLRADIGGEKVGMALFEDEVSGRGVAEELITAADDFVIDGDHALNGIWTGEAEGGCRDVAGKRGEVGEPVKAPLQWTDDAVGVLGGEHCFPGVHPLGVKRREHCN